MSDWVENSFYFDDYTVNNYVNYSYVYAAIAISGFVLFHSAMINRLKFHNVRWLTDIAALTWLLANVFILIGMF